MTIQEEIRAHRRAKRLKIKDVARMCDISVDTLSKIERGKRNPSFGLIVRILSALELEVRLVSTISRKKT